MQNLLDLFNRCFINAASQSWAVDLVNLSFRNMQLTFSQTLLPTLSRNTLAPSTSLLGKSCSVAYREAENCQELASSERLLSVCEPKLRVRVQSYQSSS